MKRSRLFKRQKEEKYFEERTGEAVAAARRRGLVLKRDRDIPSDDDLEDDEENIAPPDLEGERDMDEISAPRTKLAAKRESIAEPVKAKRRRVLSDSDSDDERLGSPSLLDGDEDDEYAHGEERKKSIVCISTTASAYEYIDPHVKSTARNWSGSGTVVKFAGELFILTNAHVVDDFRSLQVRKSTDARKFRARPVNICPEADLALLKIAEAPEEFFDGVKPIEIAFELPVIPAGKKVSVKGFPMGGKELSETFGRVSRVEVSEYVHRGQELLQVQVDAAINSGNSGGPCFHNDKLCGVAFQGIGGADNLGYIIPNYVVEKFLYDSLKVDPRKRGFPEIPIDTQDLENDGQREALGLKAGQTGILVLEVSKLFRERLGLQKGDVLLEINGKQIHNDSTIDYPWLNHVDWTHEIAMANIGDRLPVKVLRGGRELELEINIESRYSQSLMVRPIQYNRAPTYLIESGFQFAPVCQNNLLGLEEDQSYKGQQMHLATKSADTDEIIYISNVFTHDKTRAFDAFQGFALNKVNGVEIKNMVQLKQTLDSLAPGDLITYELCNKALIHMRKFTPEQDEEVVERNDLDGVPKCSKNLREPLIRHYFAMQVDPRARVTKTGEVVVASNYDYSRDGEGTLDLSVIAKEQPASKPRAMAVMDEDDELVREVVLEADEDVLPAPSARKRVAHKAKESARVSIGRKRTRVEEEDDEGDSLSDFIVEDGEEYTGLANLKGGRDALDAIRQLSMAHRGAFMQRLADAADEDEDLDYEGEVEEATPPPAIRVKRRRYR